MLKLLNYNKKLHLVQRAICSFFWEVPLNERKYFRGDPGRLSIDFPGFLRTDHE